MRRRSGAIVACLAAGVVGYWSSACALDVRPLPGGGGPDIGDATRLAIRDRLALGQSVTAELDLTDTVLEADGTRGPALLLELPAISERLAMTVLSKWRWSQSGTGVVYPRLRLLDAGFALTREIAVEHFHFRVENWKGRSLQATVFFNAANVRERYLLITANPAPGAATVATMYSDGRPNYRWLPLSTGTLSLELKPYQLETVGRR